MKGDIMSDTQSTEKPEPTVAEKRLANLAKARAAKNAKPKAAPAPKPDPVEFFEGITAGPNGSCCDACQGICVITGDICGHPHKSSLQAVHQVKPDVLKRYAKVKAYLKRETDASRPV
jgi:hypothetical protein